VAKCYVVWKGHKTGVFETWEDCQRAVAGYSGAKYRSFRNLEEAKAAFNPTRPAAKANRLKTEPVKTAAKFEVVQRYKFPVQIYPDGACDPNPGPCASGVVVMVNGEVAESWLGAYSPAGTNNAAELRALEQALRMAAEYVAKGYPVEVLSDSAYSLKAVAVWAGGWEANGWTKKDGELANVELIKSCYALLGQLGPSVQLTHVEGHAGNRGNELADQIAGLALTDKVTDWTRYTDNTAQEQRQA
jgi:ribonuclease HI